MSDKANAAENMAAEDWAGEMGERWLRNLDRFESMIAPVGEALLQRADYQPGQSVLDIGCGGGASARPCGPRESGGRVMGVDISHTRGQCEQRAHAAGHRQCPFRGSRCRGGETARRFTIAIRASVRCSSPNRPRRSATWRASSVRVAARTSPSGRPRRTTPGWAQ
jgi:SAM-dependent methyltransferase